MVVPSAPIFSLTTFFCVISEDNITDAEVQRICQAKEEIPMTPHLLPPPVRQTATVRYRRVYCPEGQYTRLSNSNSEVQACILSGGAVYPPVRQTATVRYRRVYWPEGQYTRLSNSNSEVQACILSGGAVYPPIKQQQ